MSENRRPRDRPRATRALALILGPLLLAAVVAMVLTWPQGSDPVGQRAGLVDVDVEHVTAQVTGTRTEQCESTIEDRLPDGTQPDRVECLRVLATVTSGAQAGTDIEVWATSTITAGDVPDGTRIVVQHYPAADGAPEAWAWSDFARGVPLATLALAFVLITALVAGWRGLRAIAGLVIAFVVLWQYVLPGLIAGEDAVVLALSASAVIMAIVLYLAHGFSLRTSTALLGTLTGLVLVGALGALGAHAAHLSGATSEEDFRLAALLGDNGASALRGVFLCGVVLAGLGVLNDVTITQASAVWELRTADPGASWRGLFTGGMRIGRDHIASTIYTIAFAYAGASLPVLLLLQIYGLPLAQTLTGGEFAQEIVRTLAGAMGLILAIPFTTAIAARVALAQPADSLRPAAGHSHAH
ncbi:YibE/F family protein [Cellulomonas sp. Root137]|uniref:YibE/F family protein n=1 Tax=Cellulomonas sp. Root137 TaxID=1736459 RepID=UPI0006F66605|nr:YibE/F family protein [Cellulomonas sp. Root137]KQY43802.1 YibE/F family protein [Cellulomonas sp. Root137]